MDFDLVLVFLYGGTPGERMCLPWLRPFQNGKKP